MPFMSYCKYYMPFMSYKYTKYMPFIRHKTLLILCTYHERIDEQHYIDFRFPRIDEQHYLHSRFLNLRKVL